jgi:hypothetical protein
VSNIDLLLCKLFMIYELGNARRAICFKIHQSFIRDGAEKQPNHPHCAHAALSVLARDGSRWRDIVRSFA